MAVSPPGNHVGQAFTPASTAQFRAFLHTVEFDSPDALGTIVTFGDSITDGVGATPGENRRWPDVLADRLQAAAALAGDFACTVVLKGSGTVIASPGEAPRINFGGNARLATAGTGDVLAGMVGAGLAAGSTAHSAACAAVWRHGDRAA